MNTISLLNKKAYPFFLEKKKYGNQAANNSQQAKKGARGRPLKQLRY